MVQGLTINRKFRAFSTLPIASESKENLAQLKFAILNILATCGNVDPKDLFEKINFRMMVSTANNFGVEIGPSSMFSKLLKVQWEKTSSTLRSW